jgi:hypothetical protein
MTLFSRMSKDDEPYRKFKVELMFPIIRKVNFYNEWSDDKYSGFEMNFETRMRYIYTDGFKQIDLSLLGFGVTIVRQYEY